MSKLEDRMNDAEFEVTDDETPVDWDTAIAKLEGEVTDDEDDADGEGEGA